MEDLLGFASAASPRSWCARPGSALASHVCVGAMRDGTPSPWSQKNLTLFSSLVLRIPELFQKLGHYQELRGYLIQTPTYCGNSFYHCVSEILKLQIIKEINFVWQPGMFIYTCIHTYYWKTYRETILTPSHIYQSIQPYSNLFYCILIIHDIKCIRYNKC